MWRQSIFLFLCSSLAFSPFACRPQNNGAAPEFYRLRLNTNPTTLDPALITDVIGGDIAAKIFNGLVRLDERLNIVPDIASSWSLSKDQRTFTFHIRNDVRFSNGRKVTAGDFRYSFERVLTPGTRAPHTWVLDKLEGADEFLSGRAGSVSGICIGNDNTLSLRLKKPFGPFLSLLAMTTAYAVPKEEVERFGQDFGTHPVGTGPYVLSEWGHGQSLTLKARRDYFDGAPRLKGILYRVIPEDLTAVLEFETGGLDALLIPSAEYGRYLSDPKWRARVFGKPGLNTYYMGLNCTRPPFDDPKARRAMNLAIDRKRILNTIFEKRGVPAIGPVPLPLWKYGTRPKESDGYGYDPHKARALLKEAGAFGVKIKIYISADPQVLDIMEVIQGYLSDAGISAEIRQLDWSAFKQAVNNGEPDAFWISWWADYPDPENYLYPLFHSASVGPGGNKTRCLDPDLDRLIETAQAEMDEKRRYALYRKAEDSIIKKAPWVFMWHRADFYIVQPRVKDFRIYSIYSIDKGMDIWLDEK